MKKTTERQKILGGITRRYTQDDIYVSMERSPDGVGYQYKVECLGCENNCDFHFLHPRKLSFAFVGKFAGLFSTPCKKLVAEEVRKKDQDGLMLPGLDANNHSHDYEV